MRSVLLFLISLFTATVSWPASETAQPKRFAQTRERMGRAAEKAKGYWEDVKVQAKEKAAGIRESVGRLGRKPSVSLPQYEDDLGKAYSEYPIATTPWVPAKPSIYQIPERPKTPPPLPPKTKPAPPALPPKVGTPWLGTQVVPSVPVEATKPEMRPSQASSIPQKKQEKVQPVTRWYDYEKGQNIEVMPDKIVIRTSQTKIMPKTGGQTKDITKIEVLTGREAEKFKREMAKKGFVIQ